MPKQPQVNTDQMVTLYIEQHLTCAEIGRIFGMSRVAVWKRLQWAGISAQQGEHVKVKCDHCAGEYDLTRARWRASRKHFCSDQCYYAALYNPNYHFHRHGLRLARKVVSEHFDLSDSNIVHHVDGNNRHNELSNLWVFSNQSEHMRFHRGGNALPIWRGDQLP